VFACLRLCWRENGSTVHPDRRLLLDGRRKDGDGSAMAGTVAIEALALGASFLTGVSSVLITPVAKGGKAVRLMVVRSAFAALFVSASLLILPQTTAFGLVTLRDVSLVFLISGPAFSAGALVYYRGIRSIGLARAYPMVNIYPLFSILFAVLLLGERPHWQVIVGTAIIVAGACLVARSGEESQTGASAPPGTSTYKWMALLVVASLLFSVSTTANKVALTGGLSPMLVNLARSLCALLLGTAMAMADGGGLSLGTLPRSFWGRIAASSLVADLVGHYIYFLAMQRGQVSTVVPLAATTPLFVIPLAHFVLKESVTWRTVVGTLLTVAGVVLVVIS